MLAWQERDEEYVNVAWRGKYYIESGRERRDLYEPMVIAALRGASFQALDAADRSCRVDCWYKGRFRQMTGPPINQALRERFGMRAVQSSPIVGGLVTGRLFWLDRRRMRINDLVVGDLVARMAAPRLERAYLAASHRETAALNERLRVARDLHDNVLQSLAGSGLQPAVIARVLDRDAQAAKHSIEEVQRQLEQAEREISGSITRLRPQSLDLTEASNQPLATRLRAFAGRVGGQWNVTTAFQVPPTVDDSPAGPATTTAVDVAGRRAQRRATRERDKHSCVRRHGPAVGLGRDCRQWQGLRLHRFPRPRRARGPRCRAGHAQRAHHGTPR